MESCANAEALLCGLCGFNIFWPKDCFEFGCLLPLSPGCAPISPLRGCADAVACLRCAPSPDGTQGKMLLWGSHPSPLAAPDNRALRSCSHHTPAPAGCLQRSHPSSLPGSDLRSLSFSTQPPSASQAGALRAMTVHFSFCKLVVALSFEAKPPSVPPVRGLPGCKNLSSPTARSEGHRSCPSPFLSLSLFSSFVLPSYVGFLAISEV